MKALHTRSTYKLSVCKNRKLFCIVKGVRWFILLCPGILSGQWSFDFEKNSMDQWGQSPLSRWEISSDEALKGHFSLHHSYDNPGAGEDYAFVRPLLNHLVTYYVRRHQCCTAVRQILLS